MTLQRRHESSDDARLSSQMQYTIFSIANRRAALLLDQSILHAASIHCLDTARRECLSSLLSVIEFQQTGYLLYLIRRNLTSLRNTRLHA